MFFVIDLFIEPFGISTIVLMISEHLYLILYHAKSSYSFSALGLDIQYMNSMKLFDFLNLVKNFLSCFTMDFSW